MITFEHIRRAVSLQAFDGIDAQMKMAPSARRGLNPDPAKPPRQSAVLILIHPRSSGLHLILTKRTDHLRGHSGQVSFPGGSQDPDDRSAEHTALREACEEIGLCEESQPEMIGRLTKMWIPPSNFEVYPVVALLDREPRMTANPQEVDCILHLALDDLLSPAIKRTTLMDFRGTPVTVPYYDVEGHIVWGATAGMLSELEQRLQTVLEREIGL